MSKAREASSKSEVGFVDRARAWAEAKAKGG